jgi:hypothetical protein
MTAKTKQRRLLGRQLQSRPRRRRRRRRLRCVFVQAPAGTDVCLQSADEERAQAEVEARRIAAEAAAAVAAKEAVKEAEAKPSGEQKPSAVLDPLTEARR